MDPNPGGIVILFAILATYAIPEYLAGRVIAGGLEQRATLRGSVRTGIVQLIVVLILAAPFITAGIALFLVCVTVIGRGLDILLFGRIPGDTKILEKYTLKQVLMVGLLYGGWHYFFPVEVHQWYNAMLHSMLQKPEPLLHWVVSYQTQIILSIIGAVFVIDGGTQMVRGTLAKFPNLTKMALSHLQSGNDAGGDKIEENSGEWIGILERLLVFTFILVEAYVAIAFVLTAKSIARFRELEDKRFAEYYLIGTTASVLVAVAAGLVVRVLISTLLNN